MTTLRTTAENLSCARDLLSDEKSWVKGSMAKDKRGWAVDPNDSSATCFCLLGALIKCYGADRTGNDWEIEKSPEVSLLRQTKPNPEVNIGLDVWEINDAHDTTHPMVIEWLERAILAAEAA